VRRRVDPGLLLVLTPLLWGVTFPATKLAVERMPVLSFMAWSRSLGFLTIALLLPLLRRGSGRPASRRFRDVLGPGLILGSLMFVGYFLQTEGQARTTATNAAFITGLYVVLAPILAAVLFHQRIRRSLWLAVVLSVAGLTLLSITTFDAVAVHTGDLLVLAGAVAWAAHIVALGHYSPRFPAWMVSVTQMAVAAALHTAVAMAGPGLRAANALSADVWPLLVITGILGSGVAFTIQVMGQARVTATRAVFLLAGESIVAAVAAAIWLDERLSPHQWLGAALVLGAMAYSELSARRPAEERVDPAVP
jgi:drug/metabolite transporter (DMT)-like permease